VLMLGALLALGSAPARGLLVGLGAAAKFAPLALAPLMAVGTGRRSARELLLFLAGLAATSVVVLAYLPDGGLGQLWDATIGYQLERDSPLSIWGLHPSLDWLQTLGKIGAVALVVAVAFVPRTRDLRQVAALAGAVLVALQLTSIYWFYFYLVWVLPLLFVTSFGALESIAKSGRSRRAYNRA
jgi:hypothetical protein